MDTREWIFVLGVIIVVVVALVMAARWRKQRFDDIRHGAHLDSAETDEDFPTDELPGGGARTVGFRDPTDILRMNDEIRERAEASKPRLSSFRPEPVVQQSLLDDDDDDEYPGQEEESVPLLLDPSDEHNNEDSQEQAGMAESSRSQSSVSEASPAADREHLHELESLADELKEEEPELALEPGDKAARTGPKPDEARAEQRNADRQDAAGEQAQQNEPGEIIIINLMTEPSQPYEGQTLVKLAQELGLRFGDMDIFHYCGRHGDEPPQFRMANLLKPGYFDIHNMERTRTHALCFFFELAPDQDNMKVYESMLSVINKLRDDLGGELHDENRSVFTIQTSEHCRNRIRDYQRRHLLAR